MERQGKDIQEITTAIEEQKTIIPDKSFEEVVFAAGPSQAETDSTFGFTQPDQTQAAADLGLTEEDVRYLQLR